MDRQSGWWAVRPAVSKGAAVSISQSLASILKDHVTLEVESIDRMYLNAYVPRLPYAGGVVHFFRQHRGQPIASSALMSPLTRDFVASIERFVKTRSVPRIRASCRKPAWALRPSITGSFPVRTPHAGQ